MSATVTVSCTVDEHGRTSGFSAVFAGSYGRNLKPGTKVLLDDCRPGVVLKVYTFIRTGGPGVSNFVTVDIAPGSGEAAP